QLGSLRHEKVPRQKVLPPTWFIRKEEEGLVLAVVVGLAAFARFRQKDWATDGYRNLVVAKIVMRARGRADRERRCIVSRVAVIPEGDAVEIVRAGFCRGVDHPTGGITKLRRVR